MIPKKNIYFQDGNFALLIGDSFKLLKKIEPKSIDLIFADPPYAESADLLDGVLCDRSFSAWCAGAVIFWELPDSRCQLKIFPQNWRLKAIRELGASRFLVIEREKNG